MKKQILLSIAVLAVSSTDIFAFSRGGGGGGSRPTAPVNQSPTGGNGNNPPKTIIATADPTVTTVQGIQTNVTNGTYAAADVAAGAAVVANKMGGNANSVAGLTTQAVLNAQG